MKSSGLLELRRRNTTLGKPRLLAFAGQSTREERAVNRENSRSEVFS